MFRRSIISSAAVAAAMLSLGSAVGVSSEPMGYPGTRPDPTSRRAYSRKRLSKARGRGHTKRTIIFAYKGSKRAKRATRLGGNHAKA